MKPDYEIIAFQTAQQWRDWLINHHATQDGIWMQLYKKASNVPSITYAEALDQALCFGWIDGQVKRFDELSYLQKFTPRRKASLWSKRNIEYIERLTAAGFMQPAGMNEVDRAKADGRWAAAYDKPSEMVAPQYFLDALHARPKAAATFASLNKTNTYAILWQLQTAKTETTRLRRLEKLLAMLEAGEKPH
jgi:uncharacterized protein YdeI (YjbR/CyaY-like superfamily)